jgi:hypothetical protein
MFVGATHCGSCHSPEIEGGKSAQAMYDDITAANDAYAQAEASVQAAADLGMVVATEKNQLRDANTDIVTARAVQHTTSEDQVEELTAKAQSTSEQVKASADAAVAESFFRRKAMIIAVIAIALVVGALYLYCRESQATEVGSWKPPPGYSASLQYRDIMLVEFNTLYSDPRLL